MTELKEIISHDNTSMYSTMILVGMIGAVLFIIFGIANEDLSAYSFLLLAYIPIYAIILFVRNKKVNNLLKSGMENSAEIIKVKKYWIFGYMRFGRRFVYNYNYKNKNYTNEIILGFKNPLFDKVASSKKIDILINPNNPKESVAKILYEN